MKVFYVYVFVDVRNVVCLVVIIDVIEGMIVVVLRFIYFRMKNFKISYIYCKIRINEKKLDIKNILYKMLGRIIWYSLR